MKKQEILNPEIDDEISQNEGQKNERFRFNF